MSGTGSRVDFRMLLARHNNLLAIVAIFLWTCALSVAWGNGDEFFRADAFSDDKPLDTQVIYNGSVRDEEGNYIEDATITVGITVQTPRGERRVTYNAYTNNIGRYRTLDVATVILVMEEVTVEVDPRQVDITVDKTGYRLVRRLDRSRVRQTNGVFEIDFWMDATESAGQ
jgi:hypothetical protein